MTTLDAFHLPGLADADVAEWNVREYGDGAVRLRFPVLAPGVLGRLLDGLRRARAEWLADRPVMEIVRAVDAAARRLLDPRDPVRRLAEQALPAVTGYSPPMVRLVLDRMAADWRSDALDRLLRAELGDPGVLDGFRAARGGDGKGAPGTLVHAVGPELAFHVFAGNVPGVAVTSLVRTLVVKAATLGKTASGDPLLPALFARTLAEAEPRLGACLAVTYWPGGSAGIEREALDAADTVVVYGGEDVVESLRARASAGSRLVEHGPRLSFAIVARESLAPDAATATAASTARAVAAFDQQGCVSPHVVYVEDGGAMSPRDFAAALAEAMRVVERELPRGRLTTAEAAAIRQIRGAAEFAALGGRGVELFASDGTEFTVVFDPDPAFDVSCLNRVVRVKPIDRIEAAAEAARPFARYLQTVGIAAPTERRRAAADRLARIGASRITDIERMPWPPATWHHDGREPLRELIRWVDLEG
ncbi:MAG TPA: acyl-CoA reductase [Longimicrobiales bacterium]